MTDKKIEVLMASILSFHKRKLDELLSNCESPIEQLTLLHLYNYFLKFSWGGIEHYRQPEFIDDYYEHEIVMSSITIKARVKKRNHRIDDTGYCKIIGFNCKSQRGESLDSATILAAFKDGSRLDYIRRDFEVYPQFEVSVDDSSYRIDIAIFLHRVKEEVKEGKKHDIIIETKKVALECDGYEFHSTKEQQTNDNKRTRKLEKEGWRVIRYSGAELYKTKNADDFNKVFDEIMNILFAK